MQNIRFSHAALVLTLGLAACAPATEPGAAPAPGSSGSQRSSNQSLRIAQIGLPGSMSPEASAFNFSLYGAIYDPLIWVDKDYKVVPWAATKWEAVDPTTWRFTLRQDMTFSNGDKLTADDVEFTLNTIVSEKWPQTSQMTNLTGAKKVDDYTVDVTTRVQDASVVPGLLYAWILPKNYYTAQGKAGFTTKPIGSGPYELVEYRNNDVATFKKRANEHPFRKAIATDLTVRSITEQTQMAAGLQTGDLDIVHGSLSPDVVEAISRTNAKVEYRTTSNINGLYSQPESKERNSPLTNKTVRLALNYAVDKEALSKNLYKGYAVPTGQLSIPSSPGWDENVKPIPYDPAKAKQLLAEAGYPNGFKLPVGIDFTPQTVNPNIATVVQSNLRDVGVEAAVNSMELAVFLDKYYGRNGQSKGDIFLQSTGDPNGFMTQAQGLYSCAKPANAIWWCNPDFDSNMAAANAELDVAKRSVLMRKAVAAFTNDVSHLNLIISSTFIINQPKIQGFVWGNNSFFLFDDAYRVD